jgi:Transposase DDE domain
MVSSIAQSCHRESKAGAFHTRQRSGISRDLHEEAPDVTRRLMGTKAFYVSTLLFIVHSSECFSFIQDWVEKKVRRHMGRAQNRKGFGWNSRLVSPPAHLGATTKTRWVCEQAQQQMKEELGLDHFEGRSWHGLHRHALMTMIAYAFLQHRRLATARREKKNQRAAASANFARRAPRHPRTLRSTTTAAMPALSKMDLQRAAA